ncbi:sigma-70 family RNA polymerase sigma factor [Paenibacillus sp. JCM 10914]|uniref:RNA polymerase sigma factor SigJ n=1 Tax=Paenibacillus sp. JCM 10914 TaxID=1236974 RepID=UPI0003CC40A8|nr:RNA polymerase sigma factor SigJ [Paenibacillus sp. JCM 10914]GAE06389.1 RNA polymerase sigma-70 factor, ECF subfamily [Paenibacillus sp. JCM 10914]
MTSTESLYKMYRSPLFSLAYRMTGSVMDAEDIVQEAFLRYSQLEDRASIRNERAFLYKIVTNRCLDLLRSSAKKRELYVGPWLPEPLIENERAEMDPSDLYVQQETISTAYLLMLQQLNALERAIFLLREIFGYSYDEIADMLGKSSANCRQIYHRVHKSFHHNPEEVPSISIADELVTSFVHSLMQGNTNKLLELLSENVVFYSDGGGKVRAAQVPVAGALAVIKLHQNLLKMYEGQYELIHTTVNGLPGIRLLFEDGGQYIYSFAFANDKIVNVYSVANPDKLRHVTT